MMTGAMHGAGWIFMIFFWTLIVLGVAALEKWLFLSDNGAEQQGRGPLDALKHRYARGEVSREQYEQMRRVLES